MNKKEFEIELKNILLRKTKLNSVDEIDGSRSLKEYLNSITYIQFLVALEDKFEFEVDDDVLNIEGYSNLDSLVDVLYGILDS